MNSERIEKLAGRLCTGAIAFGLGAFLLVWGWLLPLVSGKPAMHKRMPVDPYAALGGGLALILVGVLLAGWAIIGKVRSERQRLRDERCEFI